MQGVEILIAVFQTEPHFLNRIHGRNFYRSLIEENLMDKCSMVVARIVDNYDSSRHADKSDSDLKTVMERHSMDLTNFTGKLRKQSSTSYFSL